LPEGFNFKYDTAYIGTGIIGPKFHIMGSQAPVLPEAAISPQDILDVQAGRKHLYLWGWAKYFDVFPGTREHITRFCWIVTPIGDPLAYDQNLKQGDTKLLVFNFIHNAEGNYADDT